ncbi:E2 domain-associated cysteine-rich protein [Microbulbifer sp.]|uniref:E2 domain-associated cysteine-rich protein n=1 Tax=Microbulbifer sp. TaxID=1908541 RepID=UPI00338E83D9
MTTAIELITQVAPDFRGVCERASDSSATLDLPIRLVDGRVLPYRLLLREKGEWVSAQEETPNHLPYFCPERHINPGGTFCLNYSPVDSLNVMDEASARAWLETVYKFLRLQDRAKRQRKWPNSDTWAHGDAARHQLRAQTAAATLSGEIAAALADCRLTLKRRASKGRQILEIWIGDAHVYSVWESNQKVINKKRRCFCGESGLRRPKRLRRCGNHAKQASELALAVRDREDEEERFWDSMRHQTCCGTCDACPLQRLS